MSINEWCSDATNSLDYVEELENSSCKSVCCTTIVSPTYLQTEQLIVGIRCPMNVSMLNPMLLLPVK